MRTVFLAAVFAAALLLPASAHAAPFAIGPGTQPGLAVDGAGTAYIAYNGRESGSPPHFCRIPRGATACDVALTLPVVPGTDTTSRPTVTVAGARVTVLVHRTGQQTGITRYTSADGGATFSATALVGGNVPNVESVSGPGDTVSVVSQTETTGAFFQNVSLSSGTPAASIATLFDGTRPYNGTVGLIDANTPLAIFANLSSQGAFRRFAGGDINTEASWTAAADVGYVSYPRLAGGPSGLFLISGDENFGLFVRKWDGVNFGARVPLTANGDSSEMHLFQDAAGRLHAVYPSNQADGYHAEHAVSDDGVNWQAGTVSIQIDDEPTGMRVAAAPDHVGVAAWSSRSAGVPEIRVAGIGPGAPSSPAPPAPPTPTPTPPAGPVPQFHKTVVVRPISGKVRVRLKGSKTFTDLGAIDDIPLDATIDVKKGRIELASVPSRTAPAEKVQLYGGWFQVRQPQAITEFTLNEPLASCKKKARAAAAKPKSRKLWGDGKGKFRTRGQYSAATIRGTRFLVQDSCSGTLTQVKEGSVLVRDNVKRKNIVLRKGKRYTARPRR